VKLAIDVYFHQDPEVLRRLDAIQALIHTQGDRIMSQLDDLKAVQAEQSLRLDALQTEATEILADIAAVILLLKQGADLTEIIVAAQAVSDRVEGVRAGLDARPPSPTS